MLPSRVQRHVSLVVVTLGCLFAVSLISRDAISKYPDTGHFPEAPTVVKYLKPVVGGNYSVHATTPANAPIDFYLWYYGVPKELRLADSNGETQFFVVQTSQYSIDDLTDETVLTVLEFDDAALYRTLPAEER